MRTLAFGALALVAISLVVGPLALVAGCYHDGDPLPPCSASPTACGGYPLIIAKDGGP